jgi:hypothetical protein
MPTKPAGTHSPGTARPLDQVRPSGNAGLKVYDQKSE